MSDDEENGVVDEEEMGPGMAYQPFLIMEELSDKLKLLHYEQSYCIKAGHKPISRHYFALATNSGEQFNTFSTLASWLLNVCGKDFDEPQEDDDPNVIISEILDHLRKMGHKADFSSNRLKSGSGISCLWVLDRLADEGIKTKNHTWKRPSYPQEEAEDRIEDDGDDDDLLLHHNHDDADDDDDDDDENLLELNDLTITNDSKNNSEIPGLGKPNLIMESNTDAAEWKLEVERVLPQLKITLRPDNKDWRVHFEQMQVHQKNVESSLDKTKTDLERLAVDIGKGLEKVSSRETYLNSQLSGKLEQLRVSRDELSQSQQQHKMASGGVAERTKALSEITDDLDKLKREMEEKGSSMSDGTPLLRIKQSINQLQDEIKQMDIRIGVLQHTLLRSKMHEKSFLSSSTNHNNLITDADDDDDDGFGADDDEDFRGY